MLCILYKFGFLKPRTSSRLLDALDTKQSGKSLWGLNFTAFTARRNGIGGKSNILEITLKVSFWRTLCFLYVDKYITGVADLLLIVVLLDLK